MKKTIILGDTHGRSFWKLAMHQEEPIDRIIFIGDYFDSYDISGIEQLNNFEQIIQFKEDNPQVEVVMLIGNHDYHYFPEIGPNGTSGFQKNMYHSISDSINRNRHHLQMAYGFGEFLFTHAGVSPEFMDQVFGPNDWDPENVVVDLNELFRYKPKAFTFNGLDPYGDNTYQTPIWIRPGSLVRSHHNHPKSLQDKYVQVVGHTRVKKLDIEQGRYFLIDTFDTSGEYLVWQDNKLSVNSVK